MSQCSRSSYGKYCDYSSLSYDFKSSGNETVGDYGKAQESAKRSSVKVRKLRGPVVPAAIILCVLLLLAGLMSQSALVALADETNALQQEIDELLEVQTELKIEHAMAFSLADTEEYALEVLGMQKPSAEQICYLEISKTEEAQHDETPQNIVRDILSRLQEYFPG